MGPDETRRFAESFLRKHRAYLSSLRSIGFRSTRAVERAEGRAMAITDPARRVHMLVAVAMRAAPIAPDEAERIVKSLPGADADATDLAYSHLAAVLATIDTERAEHVASLITDDTRAAQARRRIATAVAAIDLARAEQLALTAGRAEKAVAQRAHALLWVAEQAAKSDPKQALRLIARARGLAVSTRNEFLTALADLIADEIR